jgi:hypothetical protein
MKKAVLLAAALAAMPFLAFGHGHRGRHGGDHSGYYQLCPFEDCSLGGNHYHNGVCYSGHYENDGHEHHR